MIGTRVVMFDKIKNYFMPLDKSRYSPTSFYLRSMVASIVAGSLTCVLAYPLDLISSRIACDMTPKG
jgi:hypothetical protein